MGLRIMLWMLGLVLNALLLLTLTSFVFWAVQWYLKRFRGVSVTVKGFRVFWTDSITVKTSTMELMLVDIWLSVRLCGRRSLFEVYVKEIHLAKHLEKNVSQHVTASEKTKTNSKAPPTRMQRLKLAVLFKLAKTVELSVERLHVQLHNADCPDLMLSLVVLGGMTYSALPASAVAGCLGVNFTASNVKSVLLLDPEMPIPSTDDGMLCLSEVTFSCKVIINLNTLAHSSRRLASLHVNVLPTCVNLLEGFDQQLMKLLAVQRPPSSSVVQPQQHQGVKPPSSNVLELLSLKCEILFDDIQVAYRSRYPVERPLSLNVSSLSLTTNQLTDQTTEPSHLQDFTLLISEAKLCYSNKKVLATLKRLRCGYEHGGTVLKNCIVIESFHNFYNEREVNHWITHFSTKLASSPKTDSPHKHNSTQQTVAIPHMINAAFRSPTIFITTVEISDCSLSLLLHKGHQTSKEPLCDVVIASVELSCQCLEPEDCYGTDHRALRASVRLTDGYIFVPSDKTSTTKSHVGRDDDPDLLPSSKRHVWGRLVSIGNFGLKAMLSVELSPKNNCNCEIFQINSATVSTTTNVLVGEWSHAMYAAVSQLLKHYKPPRGILRKQQEIVEDDSNRTKEVAVNNSQMRTLLFDNKWCVLREDLDELEISCNFLDINLFVYNTSPGDPSLLGHVDSCCVKTAELHNGKINDLVVTAHCSDLILLPFSVDDVVEPFLCSSMSVLPRGLVEMPTLTCTLNCAEKLQLLDVESLTVNWSAQFHCAVNHVIECLTEQSKQLTKMFGLIQSKATLPGSGSCDQPQPIDLNSLLSKLPVCLSTTVNSLAVHVAVDQRAKVSLMMKQATLSAKPEGIMEVYSGEVLIIFDQHKILTIEGLSGQCLNNCEDLVATRQKFKETLLQKENLTLGLSASKVLVTFPFDYKFTVTFQKLLRIKKLLQSLHHLPTRPSASGGRILLPDLLLQVDELNFQLNDDPFEVKLGTNFELQRDEQLEREKRLQALESALEKQRKEHGALLPAKKVQALYEALEEKDAQIYCKRAKEVHESESGPQNTLFLVTLYHAQLSILSDPSVEGVTRGSKQIRNMDPESPFPDNMQFDTLLGRYVYGEAEQLDVQLRDYPQPLHKTTDFTVTGCIIVAEPLPTDSAIVKEYVIIGDPWENFEVTRTLTPLKIYYDLDFAARQSETALGVCYDACFAQINLAFENLIPTSIDPSTPLPYWDKIRLFFHGKYHIMLEHGTLVLLASRDPYDAVKHMDWQFTNLDCTHHNGGNLCLNGALNVFMHTASKYDDCRSLHFPHATCTMKFDWLCQGNPHDHHSLMPCVPDRIPQQNGSDKYDTYVNYRSKSLDWNITVDVENTTSDVDDEDASLLLYASTLRWVQSYYQVIQDISRPIRKGAIFHSVMVAKPTFFRSIRKIMFSLTLPMGSITYWGSFSQQRGVELKFKKAVLQGCYVLTLKPFDDELARRSESKWDVVSLIGEADDITCSLHTIGEAPPNKEAEQETSSLRSDEGIDSHLLFTTDSIKYSKNKNRDEDNTDGSFDQLFQHQLVVINTRFSWTFVNRSIINNLLDAYTKAQILKKNLSAEAVRSIALILDSQGNKSFGGADDGKTPTPTSDSSQATPDRYPKVNRSSSGSKLLKQLLLDTSSRIVSHVEERAPSDPYLKGRLACSQDDVTKRNWFIELRSTQLALQGTETEGFVLVTSALSRVLAYEHKPQWREGDLKIKKSWVAKVEEMQYFATLTKLSQIPWVSNAVVSNLSMVQSILPTPRMDSQSDQVASVDTLLGELGPDSSSEQLDDKLFMTSPTLARGEAVGGMVDSSVEDEYNEPVQLQRITSRCFCQIYYVNYGTEAENVDKDSVPPVAPMCSPAGITTATEAVNTFTIRHPSVEISTTSFQHSVILDIINNLLLYKQSRRKEELGKLYKLKFSLQLGNIKDYKDCVLTLQNKVRKLLSATRKLEKDMYLAQRTDKSTMDDLDKQLSQHKAWLTDTSIKLSLTIRLLKESQLKAVTQLPHGDDVKCAEPIRRIEVWLDDARWWLTQDDGQLHMCDITFTNCSYNQLSFSDDSAEHKFELGTFKVCNHLSNCRYPDVLYPHDPKHKHIRVDKDISLRIYCRDQAPVGGISVKEHFEINVIPLTVKISERFYNAIERFFFPKKSVDDVTDYNDVAHINLLGTANAMAVDVEETADGHVFSRKGSMRTASKMSVTAASSTTSLFTTTPSKSKDATKLDDLEQMKERAQQTKTFIYIKIPKIPLCISYKAEKGANIKDVQDFMVTVPTLEYHNCNWTWTDMLMEVKKVYKQHIIQKGIKNAFGMREEDEAAKPSPLSIGGIDPSRLLMGKKYVKSTVKASRRLFKKSNSKSSSTAAANHSDDEHNADQVDDSVEQSDV